jgi:protein-export membrane protein SecD
VTKTRITAALILVAGILLGLFAYNTEANPDSEYHLQYGLDLSGGAHLVYEADVSDLTESQIDPAMSTLRDNIEQRVNALGVSEPLVQVETTSITGETRYRLIVELPGVQDVDEAKKMIGEAPLLEFKLRTGNGSNPTPADDLFGTSSTSSAATTEADNFESTDPQLTGRFVESAQIQFGGGQGATNQPVVLLNFNDEGAEIFANITTQYTGEVLGVFLDGRLISSPVIQTAITGGTAQISGNFTTDEALELRDRLNLGALPVPIEVVAEQTIGATLGQTVKDKGIQAGIVGLILVSLFLIGWYRLPGVVAVGALVIYILLMLLIFKLIPVTLTAAGIAGFILSIGMAVDANILIFERVKEELGSPNASMQDVIEEGFSRAWPSIRDANISSLITAVILFYIGTTLTQGFAVTFGLGVLVSMISAITISRTFLLAIAGEERTSLKHTLFAPGLRSGKEFNEHTQ